MNICELFVKQVENSAYRLLASSIVIEYQIYIKNIIIFNF